MTIKNNGGIFGRNPTFNDVTIEGQLTFDGDIDVNSDLKVDGNLVVTGTGDFDGDLNVNAGSIVVDAGTVNITHPFDRALQINRSGANTFSLEHSTAEMYLYNVTTASPVINFKNNSNVHINSGNLVFGTAGNGIDFSATAGTGTSELFDDYEEGTWTPAYLGSVSNPTITYDIQVGLYVKIGRLCHAVLRIRTDSVSGGSGNLRIGGLPFLAFSAPTSSMSGGITVNRADSFTTNTPAFGVISGGADYIDLNYDLAANAVTTANLTNAANSNTAIISIVYQTA